jgi:hypothetical protein
VIFETKKQEDNSNRIRPGLQEDSAVAFIGERFARGIPPVGRKSVSEASLALMGKV